MWRRSRRNGGRTRPRARGGTCARSSTIVYETLLVPTSSLARPSRGSAAGMRETDWATIRSVHGEPRNGRRSKPSNVWPRRAGAHVGRRLTSDREYLTQMLFDASIHGWDVAQAIGVAHEIPDEVARELYAWFAPQAAG